jgi:peptidyl-prolyl cis-trans isomerase C
MLFAHTGGVARWILGLTAATLASIAIAGAAVAQTSVTPSGGLPPPDFASDMSLRAALAELDRSAATIVAQVGRHTVTWGDIADAIRAMPPVVGNLPFPALYQRAAMQLMQQEALALRGESAGLDKDKAVRRRLEIAADQAMATEVLRRSLAPNLTDKALRQAWQALVADKPAPEEVRARVIMVESPELATTLIARLQHGADFASLAHDFSKDGTAGQGGDIGYVRLDMVSPEIGSVIFALAPGQITSYPVRSRNAWFILRVEGRRQPAAPTFEAARGALERDIIHSGAAALMSEALKAAPVTYYGLIGKTATEPAP